VDYRPHRERSKCNNPRL